MSDAFAGLTASPLVAFTLLLLAVLVIPPIFERLRLPGLVGLLVAGICLGPDGLGLLNAETETMKLFSDIGKIYLMFVAGLEIDLAEFRRTKEQSLTFGITTFTIPLIIGSGIARGFGLGWNAAILVGSLLASHTLLGYPIVSRLGLAKNRAITATVGATIFTDIAALLVLAVCVSIHGGDFSATSLVTQLGSLAIYVVLVLYGIDRLGKDYFRRTGDEESNQFLFILLVVFLASVGAQVINIDKIVGAFLAGLAVNDVLQHSPVEEKVVFVGSTLFIPFFFVDMGLLLNVSGLVATLSNDLLLTLAIVIGLLLSKFLASAVAKAIFRYSWLDTLMMWSLSMPQVAATLAATLVGVNVGLLPGAIFNVVVVLMLVTSILGPVLTVRWGRILAAAAEVATVAESVVEPSSPGTELMGEQRSFTVVIPVANPQTERYLIELGTLLARHEEGRIMPLAIAEARAYLGEPKVTKAMVRAQRRLDEAAALGQNLSIPMQPLLRLDDDIAHGISRTAREHSADLIVMGWNDKTRLQSQLFGNVVDDVFWTSHCPVAVVRLLHPPETIRRVLVPVKDGSPQTLKLIQFARLLAESNQAEITLLHVYDYSADPQTIAAFSQALTQRLAAASTPITLQTECCNDVVKTITDIAFDKDLVILRSIRRRTAGGLSVSDVTTRVLANLTGSVVLFGEG
ncbi:MAG: cation:proton antiporter [Cyanobacteria bacterium J06648_16]